MNKDVFSEKHLKQENKRMNSPLKKKVYRKFFAKLLFIIALFVVFGIAVPKLYIQDNKNITLTDIACAKRETYFLVDNPVERIFVIEIAAAKKEQQEIYTNVYTLFGLKYAEVVSSCKSSDDGSSIIWRRWGTPK